MRSLLLSVLCLLGLIFAVSALPDEVYEAQRVCWKKDQCVQRTQYVPQPSGDLLTPTDGSIAVPMIAGLNTNGNAAFGIPSTNVFTDQYRMNGQLARDDVDALEINYNHAAAGGRSTAEKLLSHLLVLSTEEATNVNVVWAIFGGATLAPSVDGQKVVAESVVRNRTGGAIPASLRLLASARLSTKDRTADYVVGETATTYYSPLGFSNGCVGFMPPFTYEGCDYANGIVVNPNKEALPSQGKFLVVLYEEKGKPVSYILSTGSHSLLNYLPIPPVPAINFPGYTPSGPFAGADPFILGRNFQKLLDFGELVYGGFDARQNLSPLFK